jgi:hypothetical protein
VAINSGPFHTFSTSVFFYKITFLLYQRLDHDGLLMKSMRNRGRERNGLYLLQEKQSLDKQFFY